MPHTETTLIKKLTTIGHTRADLRGCVIVPMMTPFTSSGQLDEAGVGRLVEHIMAGGCQAVLAAGLLGADQHCGRASASCGASSRRRAIG